MRQCELIALCMLLAGIATSVQAQDAMVQQQKPVEKNQPMAGGDKVDANGKQATAVTITDKSSNATITDPANPAAHANVAKP